MLRVFSTAFVAASFSASVFLVAQEQKSKISIASIESSIRSQQYDRALEDTKSGLRKVPSDFRLWTLEGVILSLKGSSPDALIAFDKALRLSPNYVPALKGEVQVLFQSGEKRAIPLLERILKAEPKDQIAHEMLGVLEQKQGDCHAAIDQFVLGDKATETHPESLEAYGYCLVQMKELQKATAVFEQLVALLPDLSFPKYDLAVVLIMTKEDGNAIKLLEPLLTEDQRDPGILSLAAEAYEAVGNTPKAVSLLRQAIVLTPKTASNYVAFAVLCLDHDSFQVGIDMTSAGLQRIPNDPSLFISRGLLYAQLAQYDKAEADFNMAEQLDSTQSLGAYAVDLVELQKNNPNMALSSVRSQLRTDPNSPLLNLFLAQLLMNKTPAPESAEYQEALRSALLAVKIRPDLVASRDILATMYMQSGQYELAIEQCRLALQSNPSDEAAMYHLIISLRHSGNRDELPVLVKRLSEMHQESLHQETRRKRFRLVEQEPASPSQ
jgi:tetratricopeptide (TPR) repeat protein